MVLWYIFCCTKKNLALLLELDLTAETVTAPVNWKPLWFLLLSMVGFCLLKAVHQTLRLRKHERTAEKIITSSKLL
jgi:hypothetical protein